MPNFADITTLNSTNAPRLLRAVFVLERDLLSVPSPDDTSTIRQEISLSANAESYALYHTRETEQFTERKEVTAAGKRYEQTLRLNVPRSRAAIDAVLDAIGSNKVAVAFVDRNGAARLVRRLRLQHELTIANGNSYQLTFAGESKVFGPYLTQNVFDALAGDAEYIDEEDVVTDPDPLATGEKLFVWYSAATAATYAASRDWYIDLGTSVLRIKGDVRLTSLETGNETGILAYDANNKLLKSSRLQLTASGLRAEDYGTGLVTGIESTFAAFDSAGNVIESQLITISNGNIGIGTASPNAKLDVNGAFYLLNGNQLSWHNGFGTLTGGIYSDGGGGLDFFTRNGANRDRKLKILNNGKILLDKYGTGSITGTLSQILGVTLAGDMIEPTIHEVLALAPAYATNAAALTAGLAAGDTYYNSTLNYYTRVI